MAFNIADFMKSLNKGKKEADDYLKENEPQDGYIGFFTVSEQLTNENLTTLFDVLKENDTVITINFNCCCLGDEKVKIIMNALQTNQTITELRLFGNNLTHKVGAAIGIMLEQNKTLKILNLGQNDIGDKGAINIARLLEFNKTLEELNMFDNNIKKAGPFLVKAAGNSCKIDLSLNNLGNEEAFMISATMYDKNQPAGIIATNNSNISNTGARPLLAAQQKSGAKTHLRVGNGIEDKIDWSFVKKFAEQQKKNEELAKNKEENSKKGGRD